MKIYLANKIVEDIYFVFQPIMYTNHDLQATVDSYEVLLRSKDEDCFPVHLFAEILKSKEHTSLLFKKYTKMVEHFMATVPEVSLSFNLRYQQLEHSSMWRFLTDCQSYSNRMVIEFTENTPKDYQGDNSQIGNDLEKVRNLGYRVALDDVGTGMNTLAFVTEHIAYLSWIKLSVLPFSSMERTDLLDYIRNWAALASNNQIRLVVEAVEDEEFAEQLHNLDLAYQQGFLWGSANVL